jgi:hypothetical protein
VLKAILEAGFKGWVLGEETFPACANDPARNRQEPEPFPEKAKDLPSVASLKVSAVKPAIGSCHPEPPSLAGERRAAPGKSKPWG